MPSTWVYRNCWLKAGYDDGKSKDLGNDKAFWPKSQGVEDFDKAMQGDKVYPKAGLATPFRCIIKRTFKTEGEVSILKVFVVICFNGNNVFRFVFPGVNRNETNAKESGNR